MLNVTVAERILETVTTSSRASSIAGDLLEESSNRSLLWFWLSVLKIFASHVCHDLQIHWRRMIWIGVSGTLKYFILISIAAFVTAMLIFTYDSINKRPPDDWLFFIILIIWVYIAQILTSWHIAKRSHGFELAASVSFAAVSWIFPNLFLLLNHIPPVMTMRSIADSALPIAIAFWFRYRTNKHNRNLPLENI